MDSFKCSKCFSIEPEKNMNIFSCKHSLCYECLFQSFFKDQFTILKSLIYSNKIKIECPICASGNIELNPNDFLTIFNIKESENLNKIEKPNCKMHKKNSEYYCEQCDQYYCNECIRIHNEIGNSHHRIMKEKNEILEFKCPIHELKINNYCIKCNEMVCNCCISVSHTNHKIIKLNQYIKDCYSNLDFFKAYNWDELVKNQLNSNSDFENVYKETLENSIKQIDELINVLNSFKQEYLEKMEEIHLTQININKILNLSYDKIKNEFEEIEKYKEFKKLNQIYKIIFLNDVYKMFKEYINEKKNKNVIEKEFYFEEKCPNNLFKTSIFIKDDIFQNFEYYKQSFLSSTNSNNQNYITSFQSKIDTNEKSLNK